MRHDSTRPSLPSPLLPAILLLAACGAGERAATDIAVRDSAGIAIVENTAAVWPEGGGWHLSPEPLVEIGALDGAPEDQLFRVVGARRLGDGRIVVANSGTHELRFYDAQGRHLRSVGREGEGPGEFRGLGAIHRYTADSIVAYDFRLRRLSIFDADGGFGRSMALPVIGERTTPQFVGAFDDGTILLRTGRIFSTRDELRTGVSRDSSVFYRVAADGAVLDTIGVFPGSEAFVYTIENGLTVMGLAFGRNAVADVQGLHFYFGAGETYEVAIHAADGALQRLVRRRFDNLAVTPQDIERYKQRQLEATTDDNWRRMQERIFAEMPFPATMPAYSRVLADAAGNLWVAEYRRPGDDQPRWTVFDLDGRMLGTVDMPQGFSPTEIGSDYVLGTIRDELDVERVRLYELVRPAG